MAKAKPTARSSAPHKVAASNAPAAPAAPVPPPAAPISAAAVPVQPGEMFELSCAAGSTASVKVGDSLPADAPEKDRAVVVVAVDGAKVTLGPLKPGAFRVSVPCAGASVASVAEMEFRVEALPSEKMPEKQAPVLPLPLAYPPALWLGLGLALLLAIALAAWGWRRARKRKRKASDDPQRVVPADELMQNFLRQATREKWAAREDLASAQRLYHEGQDRLRAYLEYKLGFRAGWATTSEYLGTLKSVLLRVSQLHDMGDTVEKLLAEADYVRFSNALPTREARENFANSLVQIETRVARALRDEGAQKTSDDGAQKTSDEGAPGDSA